MSMRVLATAGLAAAIWLGGCQGMPRAEQAKWPTGVPREARLIGGGFIGDTFTLPVDGLLYIVDPKTNAAVYTTEVRAGEPVDLDTEVVAGALMMARYGLQGVRMFEQLTGPESHPAMIGPLYAEALPSQSLTLELYFVPFEALDVKPAGRTEPNTTGAE